MSFKMCGFYGLFVCLMLVFCVSMSSSSKFDELFRPSWAFDHFVHEGDLLKLKLDNSSGNIQTSNLTINLIDLVTNVMNI